MAYTTIGIHLRGDERISEGQAAPEGAVYLAIDGGDEAPAVTIYFPHADEDALLAVSMLEAALDNVSSRIQARKLARENRARLSTGGMNGAGASVQAYRG